MRKPRRFFTRCVDMAFIKAGFSSSDRGRFPWNLLIMLVYAYFVSVGLRMSEFPNWNTDALRIHGDFLLATHDAYLWLAEVVEKTPIGRQPISDLVLWLSRLTGASLDNTAFWAPPLVASLVAVVTVLWLWRLGALPAAILAGPASAIAPSFFFRTRLGYYDTDIVTLLFPLAFSWALANWLMPHLRSSWPTKDGQPSASSASLLPFLLIALAAWSTLPWHGGLRLVYLACLGMAALLSLLTALPGARAFLGAGLLLCLIPLALGSPGMLFSAMLCLGLVLKPRLLKARHAAAILFCLVFLFFALTLVRGTLAAFLSTVFEYAKPLSQDVLGSDIVWPSVFQSVQEAQNIDWAAVLARMGFFVWLAPLGLAGYAYLLWKRPIVLLLLPFLLMAWLAPWLGQRWSMFGPPVVFIGLGAAIHLLLHYLPDRFRADTVSLLLFALIGASIFSYTALRTRDLDPTPVTTKAHALALEELALRAPEKSLIWTWWDYGYISRYLALRPSFGDGGRNSGPLLYALARVMTTDDPLLAHRLIHFGAAFAAVDPPMQDRMWGGMEAADLPRFLQILRDAPPWRTGAGQQYIVLPWEILDLMYWISYFGSWDAEQVTGKHVNVRRIHEGIEFNKERGSVTYPDGTVQNVSSLDLITKEGRQRTDYTGRPGMPHLVLNLLLSQGYYLDDPAYWSTAVQLLLAPPDDPRLSPYFTLETDISSLVRIYSVR